MGVFFYNIFLLFYRAAVLLISPFHSKAGKMVRGRKNIFQKLESAIPQNSRIIWVHCASLGEFEQGRPLIEELRKTAPACRILLTFFSPSGYEARKDYDGVDWVFYLPNDGPRNAKRFLEIVRPELVIFVKYEFWYYYLKKIKYRNIPLLLVSALFRKDMMFFRWYGALARKMLFRFDHLFVQNKSSKELLDDIGLSHITSVSGDTRFDRVATIASAAAHIPAIDSFLNNQKAIVAGSTWPEDETVLQKLFNTSEKTNLKLLIAPHEINAKHLDSIRELFPGAVFYSTLDLNPQQDADILIIDNIGMLSRLYRYAYIAFVGGGFRPNGVHNVLEAAVYGKPVLFGPYYKKYTEATGLVESGGGIPLPENDHVLVEKVVKNLMHDKLLYEEKSKAAGAFVQAHLGATKMIIDFIQEKRLLTS